MESSIDPPSPNDFSLSNTATAATPLRPCMTAQPAPSSVFLSTAGAIPYPFCSKVADGARSVTGLPFAVATISVRTKLPFFARPGPC